MAIYPAPQNFVVYRGSTFDITLTLVSGNSSVPMNLTGASVGLTVGPYLSLSSNTPTTSGSIGINALAGQISITISGAATEIFSPQPYFISLTTANQNYYYLVNGTINFISPYSRAILPANNPLCVGGFDLTIGFQSFDDIVPVPQPPPPIYTGPFTWGQIGNT